MSSFTTCIRIRVDDINYGGHMGNDKFLAFAQQARVEWLASLDQSELNCFGTGLILVEAHVRFKAEGFLGDEIEITVSTGEWSSRGFAFLYAFQNLTRNKQAAEIRTQMLAYDYQLKKVASVPEALFQALS